MSEQATYQVVVMEPSSAAVNDLLKMLAEKNKVEVSRVSSADEAFQIISQHAPCMMVCSIIDSTNIPPVVTLLKRVEKLSKHGILKTMVVSKIKAPNLGALITGLSVTDYITEPVPARTIYFKSNLQIKALESAKKAQEQKKASQQQIVIKSTAGKEGADQRQESTRPHKNLAALEIDEDTFLFKNSAVRKNGKKSIFELDGPAPDSGEWIKSEDNENSWRWEEFDKKETPEVKNGDGWTHEGEKPVYNETSKKWQFVSEKPSLAYKKNKRKIASKVTTELNGDISIAADSEKAKLNIKTSEVKAKKRRERNKTPESAEPEIAEKALKTAIPAAPTLDLDAEEDLESADPEIRKVRAEKRRKKKLNAEADNDSSEDADDKEGESPLAKMKSRQNKKKVAGPEENPEDEEEGDLTEAELRALPGLPAAKPKQSAALKFLNKNKEEQELDDKKAPPLKVRERKLKELSEREEELDEEEFEKLLEEALPLDTEPVQKAALKKLAREKRKKRENKKLSLKLDSEDELEADNPALSMAENNANRKRAKVAKAKVQKKKILQELQKVINEPEDMEITPAEELEIKKELGLSPTEPVSAKALKKRNKLAKVKRLKEKLQEVNDELDAASLPDDLDPEGTEMLQEGSCEKGRANQIEQKRRKINATDTLEEEQPDEEDSLHKRLESKNTRSGRDDSDKKYFYKAESEITPIGGKWKSVEDYYIFLAKDANLEGEPNLEGLLPVWVFKGEKAPDFEAAKARWRFLNAEAKQVKSLSELPIAIREFLLKKMAGEEVEEDTSLENISEAEEIKTGLEIAEDRQSSDEMSATLDSGEALDEASIKESRDSSAELPERKSRKTAKKDSDKRDRENSIEELGGASREASLDDNAKIDQSGSQEISSGSGQESLHGISGRIDQEAVGGISEAMNSDESRNSNEAIRKFFERRKTKVPNENQKEMLKNAAKGEGDKNPYLGIFVTFSDAFADNRPSWLVFAPRILDTIAWSMGDCSVFILEPNGSSDEYRILASAKPELDPNANAIRVSSGGFKKEIVGQSGNILGHLYLDFMGARHGFDEHEIHTLEKAAALFSKLMEKNLLDSKAAA